MSTAPATPRPRWHDILTGLLVFGAVLLVFGGATGHEFVIYDDPLYVTENPDVLAGWSGESLARAFTEPRAANWHPLTWVSHMLDVELFGLDAGAHHRTSVLLHGLTAVLLFAFLRMTTKSFWGSAFATGLFALHPLRTESVAWVAERKDVLSGVFWMATLLAHVAYARRPSWWRYALVCVALALGLLAKPMVVTLPFVLLLVDFWPLERIGGEKGWSGLKGLIVEKLPLVALAGATAVVTALVQGEAGTVRTLETLDVGARVSNALASYAGYVALTCWPAGLACFYPHPALVQGAAYSPWSVWPIVGLLFLVAGSVWAVRARSERPWVTVGWAWYVGTLVPVIGLVQVGTQALADRYTYLPTIGIVIAVVWTLRELTLRRAALRPVLALAAGAILLALGWLTARQVETWADSRTLFERALAVTEDNYVAHVQLGGLARRAGDLDAARAHFEAALAIKDDSAQAHYNLGLTLVHLGDPASAETHYLDAIRHDPTFARPYNNLALMLLDRNDLEGAHERLEQALEHDAQLSEARLNLGIVFQRLGRDRDAAREFRLGLEGMANPPFSAARMLAWLLATSRDDGVRDGATAVRWARYAVEATGGAQPAFLATLAAAYAEAGDFEAALRAQEEAIRRAPEPQSAALRTALELYRQRRPLRQ